MASPGAEHGQKSQHYSSFIFILFEIADIKEIFQTCLIFAELLALWSLPRQRSDYRIGRQWSVHDAAYMLHSMGTFLNPSSSCSFFSARLFSVSQQVISALKQSGGIL